VIRCENPRCGAKAYWWVWAPGYPRHALCDGDCVEALVERLSETNAPTLGKLRCEPIDRRDPPRRSFGFGAFV
jgi:hypothetical protein